MQGNQKRIDPASSELTTASKMSRRDEPIVEIAGDDDTISSIVMPPTPEEVSAKIERTTRFFGRTLADVAPFDADETKDKTILFRNNWLARGQAVTLVASSGVGKSSMTMQCAFNWAAGINFLADPMHPLKCAVIQAEDSERDVAEQILGMRLGLVGGETQNGAFIPGCGWTSELFDAVKSSVFCPTCFIGKEGDDFIRMLAEFQGDMKCDMLFINPVQAFFGGDISNQKDVSHWTRAGIDPIIKGTRYGGENACGAFLVMHTTKFSSGNKEGRANVDDYGEYIGAGSHEWLDWARAKFVFLKHGKSDTYFDFKAAKRGYRLRWRNPEGDFTTNKIFKHSDDGVIFWQEVTDPEEISRIGQKEASISEEEANIVAHKIVEWIRKNRAVRRSEFEDPKVFKGLDFTRRQLRAAKDIILKHISDFRMTEDYNGIGFAEGHRVQAKQVEQKNRIEDTYYVGQ